MNMKTITLATLGSALTMMLVAGLWHEIIMAEFYASAGHGSHEGRGIILIGYIILAGFMTYLYPLLHKSGRPLIEGIKFGCIIGLLWVLPHELIMAGAHGDAIGYVFFNAAWHMVEQGVGGIVIALIYAKGTGAKK